MGKLFILFTCLSVFPFNSFSTEKQDEKKYTKKEFKDAVVKEVERQLTRLGKIKIVGLSKELMKKEDDIKLNALEVQKKEEQLKINILEFEKKIKELQEKQSKFIGCLDGIENKVQKRVNHMVNVIAGMKPQTAANLLSVQESEISVKILGYLEPVKVSKIFNLMDKEISARLQKQYMSMKK